MSKGRKKLTELSINVAKENGQMSCQKGYTLAKVHQYCYIIYIITSYTIEREFVIIFSSEIEYDLCIVDISPFSIRQMNLDLNSSLSFHSNFLII